MNRDTTRNAAHRDDRSVAVKRGSAHFAQKFIIVISSHKRFWGEPCYQ